MDVQPDFKELLVLFNAHKVKYLIVGGYALAFHGAPRTTGDIDLFVEPNPKNAQKVWEALNEFGFGQVGLRPEDFFQPGYVIQLGQPPVRIDIMTSLSGVSWDTAHKTKVKGKYGGVPVFFIGRSSLLSNKRAIKRKKDEADLEALGES